MFRRFVCLLLVPCLLLSQAAAMGHAHALDELARSEPRPHFHAHGHAHEHSETSGHRHDHDSDAVYIEVVAPAAYNRWSASKSTTEPSGTVSFALWSPVSFRTTLKCDSLQHGWMRYAVRHAFACPLYLAKCSLVI